MLGLITVYKVPNYGTKLQAYAMQELLSLYDETEVIQFVGATDYRARAVLGKLKIKWRRKISGRAGDASGNHPEYLAFKNARVTSVNKFDAQFYHFSEKMKGTAALRKYMKKCKAIVCGSDQLWAPLNVDADYFTLTMVPKGIPRISYAASFGISEIPSGYVRAYKRFLNGMDAIAVREVAGKKIVEQLVDKDVTVTIDPTMMISEHKWSELAGKSTMEYTKYIFCYFLGENAQHRDFARVLSQKTGCKIITIPHCEKYNEVDENFGDIPLSEVQPQDFLCLIKNAEYVCTDSFHGTVFSVIFGKKVAVFERFSNKEKGSTNSRIHSLLDMLNLRGAMMASSDDVDVFLNYEYERKEVLRLLDAEREKSFAYLDKALGMTRKV